MEGALAHAQGQTACITREGFFRHMLRRVLSLQRIWSALGAHLQRYRVLR